MSARDLAAHVLSSLGIASLARHLLARDGRFALNFHGVSCHRYQNVATDLQPHHSVAEFRRVLEWLGPRFAFLSVDEFLNTDEPGVLLTFDDGHANNLTNILPLLAEFNTPGLFFVSTQHVKNPRNWLSFTRRDAGRGWGSEANVPDDFARDCYDGLSESQLAEMARSPWAVIGSHTVSHPSLPTCSPKKLQTELIDSRQYLQQVSGQIVNYLAYPYGYYNRSVAEAVREAGYRAAFAVDALPVDLPAYEIPRVGLYASRPAYLDAKLSGLHRRALREPGLTWRIAR
jgi:peptidoglycan/xylan/chitin deacetylase (PgdA/CDA1 family)